MYTEAFWFISGTNVIIFKIFPPKHLAKIMFFAQTTAVFPPKNKKNRVFLKKRRQFFRRKSAKIAENCDYIIDLRT
jgi:uncharacterized RDD family membrane protein YckC